MSDWRQFVALMARSGWGPGITNGVFVHANGAQYHVDGHYADREATEWSKGSLPQWREYLARGETPPPF